MSTPTACAHQVHIEKCWRTTLLKNTVYVNAGIFPPHIKSVEKCLDLKALLYPTCFTIGIAIRGIPFFNLVRQYF